MLHPTVYSHGLSYEIFIRRAHRCQQNFRTGAHAARYHAITYAEDGYGLKKTSSSQELERVKGYVAKAIARFLKRRLRKNEREELLLLQDQLQHAYNEPTLFLVIDQALEATQRFKGDIDK